LTFFHVILPVALEVVARRIVVHFAKTMFEIIFKVALKYAATFKTYFSFSFLFAFLPLSLIGGIINFIDPGPMSQPIFYIALINTSIWPFIYTPSGYSVILKLSLINDTVCPCKFAFAMQKTIVKTAFIFITIFECN